MREANGQDSRVGTGRLHRAAALSLAAGITTTAAVVAWYGIAQIGAAVVEGLVAVPAAALIHMTQLFLSALAWRSVIPEPAPRAFVTLEARWIREAINSLLPVANIGGGVAGARILARHTRQGAAAAGASLTVDITLEALAQVFFLACGAWLACVLSTGDGPFVPEWIWAGLGSAIAALIMFAAAQRLGLLKVVEALMRRLLPYRLIGRHGQMHLAMMALYGRPWRLAAATGWHFLSWSLGAAEVWVLLLAIGHPVSLASAYCIESLGLAARSVAFMIPGGLAAQEAGLVAAGALVGVPPSIALAVSMLKRVRELGVGIPGIVRWQWIERRTLSP